MATSEHTDKVDKAVALMHRNPDARMALDIVDQMVDPSSPARRIIDAYYAGLED